MKIPLQLQQQLLHVFQLLRELSQQLLKLQTLSQLRFGRKAVRCVRLDATEPSVGSIFGRIRPTLTKVGQLWATIGRIVATPDPN